MSAALAPTIRVEPFGAVCVRVHPPLDGHDAIRRAETLHALAADVAAEVQARDFVVGGGSFLLQLGDASPEARESVAQRVVARTLRGLARPAPPRSSGAVHEVEVVYDGADLEALAGSLSMSTRDLVGLHTAPLYTAIVCGFLPGFAYLAEVDPALRCARRASPRARVPAGSVAVAGTMTGVYPFASPGGWHLLGRAPGFSPFDPDRAHPRTIAPLDRVRFVARDALAPSHASASRAASVPAAEAAPHGATGRLVVTAGGALATVQDAGRVGFMREGVAWGGALDVETLADANRAVGNAVDLAAIEVPLGSLRVRAESRLHVSLDGGPARALAPGESLDVLPRPDRGVRYLAVRGGIDVPKVLGARATNVVAGFGGLGGRRLRPGDVLPVGEEPAGRLPTDVRPVEPGPSVEILLPVRSDACDPRLGEAAFRALLAGSRLVSPRSDRVGTRLDGAPVPRVGLDAALPEPVVPGAVQITTDGGVIVLGPDSATTGGYPIAAVLDAAGRARLGRARPGDHVRFVEPR